MAGRPGKATTPSGGGHPILVEQTPKAPDPTQRIPEITRISRNPARHQGGKFASNYHVQGRRPHYGYQLPRPGAVSATQAVDRVGRGGNTLEPRSRVQLSDSFPPVASDSTPGPKRRTSFHQ